LGVTENGWKVSRTLRAPVRYILRAMSCVVFSLPAHNLRLHEHFARHNCGHYSSRQNARIMEVSLLVTCLQLETIEGLCKSSLQCLISTKYTPLVKPQWALHAGTLLSSAKQCGQSLHMANPGRNPKSHTRWMCWTVPYYP